MIYDTIIYSPQCDPYQRLLIGGGRTQGINGTLRSCRILSNNRILMQATWYMGADTMMLPSWRSYDETPYYMRAHKMTAHHIGMA